MSFKIAIASAITAVAITGFVAQASYAQDNTTPENKVGEMAVPLDPDTGNSIVSDSILLEPFQLLDEILTRNDLVFVMRHGATDWSKRDIKDVAPTDCDNQRMLNEAGPGNMQTLGLLLGFNGVFPSEIGASEWCRNAQTRDSMLEGFREVDADYAPEVDTDPNLNLLLSLQGAENVTAMRERIMSWTGEGKTGPLLLISHFTNIEELTQFTVFEGEILIIDPQRDGRVVGFMRLKSAGPDVGHFPDQVVDDY